MGVSHVVLTSDNPFILFNIKGLHRYGHVGQDNGINFEFYSHRVFTGPLNESRFNPVPTRERFPERKIHMKTLEPFTAREKSTRPFLKKPATSSSRPPGSVMHLKPPAIRAIPTWIYWQRWSTPRCPISCHAGSLQVVAERCRCNTVLILDLEARETCSACLHGDEPINWRN